ncbi:hypothetical protein ABW19_dt0208660 [Dactylella cylindrospora]|nr:hypothetical protein ABW19_dt0208660 [Dactylella cylindrospora]
MPQGSESSEPQPTSNSSQKVGIILGVTFSGLAFIFAVVGFVFVQCRSQLRAYFNRRRQGDAEAGVIEAQDSGQDDSGCGNTETEDELAAVETKHNENGQAVSPEGAVADQGRTA